MTTTFKSRPRGPDNYKFAKYVPSEPNKGKSRWCWYRGYNDTKHCFAVESGDGKTLSILVEAPLTVRNSDLYAQAHAEIVMLTEQGIEFAE